MQNIKSHTIILPILGVIFALMLGWNTVSAQTVEKLKQQFDEIAALPSGSSFTLTLSDDDATAAAEEYLGKYMDTIKEAINEAIGMSLDISSPTVTFGEDTLTLNLKAGKGILKVNVSASANVVWEDNDLHVTVTELNIPIVSVPVETANSFIAGPLKNIITELLKSYDVQSFKLSDGVATLSAAKK